MRASTLLLACLGLAAQLAGQPSGTPRLAQQTPMPSDRAEISYALYSQLLGRWGDNGREWLIKDATNAIPLDVACHRVFPEGDDGKILEDVWRFGTNPHNAILAVPEDRRSEWNEVLADYDRHCHDVIELDRESFRTELPVRLLNAEETKRFDPQRASAALYGFTEVFFNAKHTLAAVEEVMSCGMLCGYMQWVVLERKGGRWVEQPWVTAHSSS